MRFAVSLPLNALAGQVGFLDRPTPVHASCDRTDSPQLMVGVGTALRTLVPWVGMGGRPIVVKEE